MTYPPWSPLDTLTPPQRKQLAAFKQELVEFNHRINLISRETEPDFEERHVLHCLALLYKQFPPDCSVVDWGTGGGLPAIPLAVALPDVEIHAVDAVGKKIQVVKTVGRRLGLANLHPWHGRAEAWPGTAPYSVSRATAPLLDLWHWHERIQRPLSSVPEGAWRPGLICLKGGDLVHEIAMLQAAFSGVNINTIPLEPLLGRSYFADKYIVEVYV